MLDDELSSVHKGRQLFGLQIIELMSMRLSLISFAFVLLSVILPAASPAFAKPQTVDFTQLEKVALEELKETNTPGAAVAVVSGDR
jgi:hypothetical protein